MKRLLAGLMMVFLLVLSAWADAAGQRSERHGAKSHVGKLAHAKKAKVKKHKAVSTSASKRLAGKKAVGKKLKLSKIKQSKRIAAKQNAGRSVRKVATQRAMTPLRQAAVSTLQLDYGDALGNGELELRSAAALVLDQKTGEALYAKNVDLETPIASITKLMTAAVTLDAGLPLDEVITISAHDIDYLKGTGSRLPLGARLTRGELLNLALIASENRAAAALSRAYPGGRIEFVEAMNRKAAELGMTHTRFVDGTGLSSQNRSTAADLARLVDATYRYPSIRRITASGSFDVSVPGRRIVKVRENGKVRRVAKEVERNLAYVNTNALTRNRDWEIGVSKTGYINEAGHCLVMQAKIAERKVIIVLLDSLGKMSRIGDANRIRAWLEHGFSDRFAATAPPQA